MASITLLQDIQDNIDKTCQRIIRLRSTEFHDALIHLTRASEKFAKARKRLKEENK